MALLQLRGLMPRGGFNNVLQRIVTNSSRKLKTKTKTEANAENQEDELNEPIKYSTSPAAKWAARHSISGSNHDDMPWYQPHIVCASAIIFLIYFLYLREANDIDAIFDRELGDYFDAKAEDFQKKIYNNAPLPPGRR